MKETLASFRLLEALGEGGMGIVYKAVDTRDGTTVALKVLSRQSLLDDELKRRFLREASAGSHLSHPNIVRIYEVGEAEGQHFISMEFVEGNTLQAIAKRGPLPPVQVVDIGLAVGDALREAHRQGIIHRDIKSANIMLSADGTVKVMDFGLAKVQNASILTREGEMLGTVAYMSPEQATGETVDKRTDIFSLGVVLYELLTGSLPFGEQYDMAVVYSILNVEPAPIRENRPDVPEALEQIVLKALRKDLQHRYQDVEDVLGDMRRLKAFLDGKRDVMPSPFELVAGAGLEEAAPQVSTMITAPRGTFEARLAGRDAELEELKTLLRKADRGEGATVFIAGEAGVGKSRLVAEVETYARTIRIHPINTRCVFREGTYPYRPIVEAVRDILKARGLETAEAMDDYFREKSPAIVGFLPVLRLFLNIGSGDAAPLLSRDRLWEAVLRLLEAVSRERTQMLFIDDLHWADEETLLLVQYLARNTAQMPVIMLGTYRPEDVAADRSGRTHPLPQIEREMTAEGCLTVLPLGRLKKSDIQGMIASLFRNAQFGSAFPASLYRESDGNPLFVMEILKLLKAEGVIRSEAGTYRMEGDLGSVSMPSRVQDIVVRRVGRLDRKEREFLEIGAVEGEVFHSDTISRCMGADRLSLLRSLQSLERDHHIIHALGKTYRFDHAKVREALYDAIAPELRTEYHGLIGEHLSEAHGDDEQLAPGIAHHFIEAGADEKALPFLVTGGRRARTLFANAQAVEILNQALRICRRLERDGPGSVKRQKGEVLEGLGDVSMVLGTGERALETYNELLSDPGLDQVRRGEILRKKAQVFVSKGGIDRALEELTEAERVLGGPEGEGGREADIVRGKIAVTRARVFKSRGEYDDAVRTVEEGLALLGPEGSLAERADAFNDLGNIYEDRSENDRAKEMYTTSLTLREEIADKKGIAVTYNNLANLFCAQGDYTNAAAMFLKSLDLMKQIGYRAGIAGTCNNLGTIYQDQGRYQDSLEMNRRGLKVREEIGDRPGIAMSFGNLGFVYLDMREFAPAREYLEKSVQLQREIGMKTLLSATVSWLALAHAGLGDLDKGIELASEAVSMAGEMHQTWYEGIAHRSLGIICMVKGATTSAGEGREDLFLKSLDHLQRSLAIFRDGGFEHEAARCSLELARLLRHMGDPNQSKKHLDLAIGVFQNIGAMGDLDRALKLTDDGGSPAGDRDDSPEERVGT